MFQYGITYVSAGHRPALAAYHTVQLHFTGDEKYIIRNITGERELDDISSSITF